MRRISLGAALVCAAAFVSLGAGQIRIDRAQAAVLCFGQPATIIQTGGTVTGTGGADVIVAIEAEAVYGLGGDDAICYASELPNLDRVIDAGAGHDRVEGCDHGLIPGGVYLPDEIHGGSGNDELTCGTLVTGGSGHDQLFNVDDGYGGSGNDTIVGLADDGFDSHCDGGSGTDTTENCLTTANIP
jgi:hypothetical protein